MCNYVNQNKCSINGKICPFVYFCDRTQTYKFLKSVPKKCGLAIAKDEEIPNGATRVIMARNGYIYVDIDGVVTKIPYTAETPAPKYVKLTQGKNGAWKVKK